MDIHPIGSDADHDAALRRIEALWDAKAGSPEADELEVLATLVERYEEALFPVEIPTPLGVLKFAMAQNGYTHPT